MDMDGCYVDPTSNKKQKTNYGDDESGKSSGPPPLHSDDAALLNWTGSLGDTAAEELQKRRERARAAARLSLTTGTAKPSLTPGGIGDKSIRRARNDIKSRVLDEKAQFWMKKTTYLTNDASRSVHKFTSLAQTKRKTATEIEQKLQQSRNDATSIERGFEMVNRPIQSRKHPTKRGVTAVMDVPLLPDVSTWGHTYTHVVLDAPPKRVPGQPAESVPTMDQLNHAFIADVQKRKQAARMVANVLVPENVESSKSSDPTLYEVTQQYDLDVYPLKDEYNPHVNFVLMIDEEKGVVTYHPVQSRVQLSTGRPPERNAAGAVIAKRAPDESDVKEMEMRVAEVDADLARKYGLNEDDGENGGKNTGVMEGFNSRDSSSSSSSDEDLPQRRVIGDNDDDDNEDTGF